MIIVRSMLMPSAGLRWTRSLRNHSSTSDVASLLTGPSMFAIVRSIGSTTSQARLLGLCPKSNAARQRGQRTSLSTLNTKRTRHCTPKTWPHEIFTGQLTVSPIFRAVLSKDSWHMAQVLASGERFLSLLSGTLRRYSTCFAVLLSSDTVFEEMDILAAFLTSAWSLLKG